MVSLLIKGQTAIKRYVFEFHSLHPPPCTCATVKLNERNYVPSVMFSSDQTDIRKVSLYQAVLLVVLAASLPLYPKSSE